ncbi:MAG: glycosyltransferase family 39 protein [Anaerolineae bacterium]
MTTRTSQHHHSKIALAHDSAQRWIANHRWLLLWAVLFLAFALRLARLTAKDIWWDEGDSVWQAPLSLRDILLYQARDQHPPLYYLVLHFWYRLAGPSLLSLRMLSVLWGTLSVAAIYALGRALFRAPWVALAASLLLAISRFHIEWSQEIKMYAMVEALTALSLVLAVRLWRRSGLLGDAGRDTRRDPPLRSVGLWLPYFLVTLCAVYTHYIAFLGLAGQGLCILILLLRRVRTRQPWIGQALGWGVSQVAVVALFAPWMLLHTQHSGTWDPSEPQTLWQVTRLVTALLSQGVSTNLGRYMWPTLLLWLPLLLALPFVQRDDEGIHQALVWALLLTAWWLTYLLTLPAFGFGYEAKLAARFFILCQLPYALLLAHALYRLLRRWAFAPTLGLIAAVVFITPPLSDYYAARYAQDDYATLARTIQSLAREGEAILLDNDLQWPQFRFAYRGSLPVHQIPSGAPGGEGLVRAHVAPQWETYDGLWVVSLPEARAQDPDQTVLNWLLERGQVLLDEPYGSRRLLLIRRTPRSLELTGEDGHAPQYVTDAALAPGVRFQGFDRALDEARSGTPLRVVSFWQIDPTLCPMQISATLVDGRGEPVAPYGEPAVLSGAAELPQRARTDIPISAALPGGRYGVRLRVADARGTLLGTTDAGTVRVVRTVRTGADSAQYAVSFRLGEAIALSGYDLPHDTFRAGDSVELDLTWRALEGVDAEYVVFVHVLGAQVNPRTGNSLWGQVDSAPLSGGYPTSAWMEGDVVRDPYRILIDPDAMPGEYSLEIGLYSPHTGERLPVYDENGQSLGDHILLTTVTVR